MATASPFQVDRGDAQARVASTALAGSYAFQLGHTSQITEYFEVGNYIELSQAMAFDFDYQKLVRIAVTLVSPSTATTGVRWRFTATLGAVTFYTRYIPADGRTLTLEDIALSLAAAPAPPTTVTVLFRLQLVVA